MISRQQLLGATLAIASLLFIGCNNSESNKNSDAHSTIKIGIDVFPGWGHAFIAAEQKYFEQHGVRVELVHKTDYLEIMEDYANGLLDGAFLVFADAIFLNDQGVQTLVPYISDHSVKGDVIYALPDIQSVTDLKGKTIGVEGINSFSHLFVLSALEKHGLTEGDVFFKNINAQELVQEINAGNIAAGHTYGPGRDAADKAGFSALAFSGEVKGIITDVLAIRASMANDSPEAIKAIVAALFEAKRFQRENPETAFNIISQKTGDSTDSIKSGIEAVQYLMLEDNIAAMQNEPSGELHQFGQKIAEFYVARGQISQYPDFKKIIDSQFVEALRR